MHYKCYTSVVVGRKYHSSRQRKIYFEKFITNPGLQHLAENIFVNLNYQNLSLCQEINGAGAANITINARARATPARVCSVPPRSAALGWSLFWGHTILFLKENDLYFHMHS